MAHFFKSKNNNPARLRSGLSTHKARLHKNQAQNAQQLSVIRLSDDGRGIATYNSKTIFIENALPNEVVDVTINYEKPKFYEGSAHTINNKSSHSIPIEEEGTCTQYYQNNCFNLQLCRNIHPKQQNLTHVTNECELKVHVV